MTPTQERPPVRAVGAGTTANLQRYFGDSSPLKQAKKRVTIFDIWRSVGLPGDPTKNPTHSPFRPDRHPSFSVTRDGMMFKDFATGERGDVVAFVMRATGLSASDAARWLIAYAGTGRSRVPAITPPTLAPSPRPAERAKPKLPSMQKGDGEHLQALALSRNLSVEGLRLASERGLLWFATIRDLSAWLITDSERVNCQARRLDGGLWQHLDSPAKAWTLPGCWASWPIGIREAQDFPIIALVEGGPDFLAAHHFIVAEGRDRDVAAVCITGASQRIHPRALPLFHNKRVRIFPHVDAAGQDAAQRWVGQLESVGAEVDCFALSGIPTVAGGHVNDVNDFSHLDADTFEQDRELWRIFP